MTATFTHTQTETWTRTHARYVAGKVAADLRQMQQAYGKPTDENIEQYLQELTVLLAEGCVEKIFYGFKREGAWVVALRYTADMNGVLTVDDRSGKVPRGADVAGATWSSFLAKNSKWSALSDPAREDILRQLPFIRTAGDEPTGAWASDKTYGAAGCGLRRASCGGAA